jgi:lipooligosaccharide transport system ATP-binding protein
MTDVVQARGLTRTYGELVAVKGIDFSVAGQECFGFLGPNGAGKTSTIRMLCCRLPVSGGRLSVLGRDVARESAAIREKIGVVPQDNNLDTQLTVEENLLVYAGFFGLFS